MDHDITLDGLTQQLSQSFAAAIGGMAGNAPRVVTGPLGGPTGETLWWQQSFSVLAEPALWLGADVSVWNALGAAALKGAGVADATSEDCRGTYLELLQQTISGLASWLSGRLGREVVPTDGKESAPLAPNSAAGLRIEFAGAEPIGPIAIIWSSEFTGFLAPPAIPAPAATSSNAADQTPAATAAGSASDRYEMLLDVEMPVSVSFGRAHLPLREIVKLTSGAIVELNRAVGDPVELIVNNCVVARGEVVVVDGNYGVRVKQIISRKERLRTLH